MRPNFFIKIFSENNFKTIIGILYTKIIKISVEIIFGQDSNKDALSLIIFLLKMSDKCLMHEKNCYYGKLSIPFSTK